MGGTGLVTHATLVLSGYLVGGTRIVTCTTSEVGVQWVFSGRETLVMHVTFVLNQPQSHSNVGPSELASRSLSGTRLTVSQSNEYAIANSYRCSN